MNLEIPFYNIDDFNLITNTLQTGTFATIYIVENLKDNKKYAVKIYNIDKSHENNQKNFLNEAFILYKVNNPSIVKFYGIDFHPYRNFKFGPSILMEYLPNGTLEQILAQEEKGSSPKQWTATRKYIFLLGISDAIRCLHKNGVILRNLNLGNVLIDEDFNPRICGFSISPSFPFPLTNSMKFDLPPEKVLAPVFRSPELIKEEQFGPAIDIYIYIWNNCVSNRDWLQTILRARLKTIVFRFI